MDASYPHVIEAFNPVAVKFERLGRLFRHGQVSRTCADYHSIQVVIIRCGDAVARHGQQVRGRVVMRTRKFCLNLGRHIR